MIPNTLSAVLLCIYTKQTIIAEGYKIKTLINQILICSMPCNIKNSVKI